jgi:DNA polymerase III subunit delta'
MLCMEIIDCFENDKIIEQIVKEKNSQFMCAGYLFFGKDSETNWQFVHNLVLGLMCPFGGCKTCPDCIKVKEGTHPDILEYPQGKSLATSDSKSILENAIKKPMIANKKIIIINNIDISSEEAQNKLLKTLEEPPKDVIFLATAQNLDKVLPTIQSRLVKKQVLSLKKDKIEKIFESERENPNFSLAIQNGAGYIGKTRNILQNKDFLQNYMLCKDIVQNLKSTANILEYIPPKLDKESFCLILENLSVFYRDILMLKLGQENLVEDVYQKETFIGIKNEYSITALKKILENINDANKKQFSNVGVNIILQTLLTKNLEVKFLCK